MEKTITYFISESANKFFILSNLTNWHFSCRKKLNREILDNYGALSTEESAALNELKALLLKYDFGRNFLGIPFHTPNFTLSWTNLENHIEKGEFETLKQVFEVFGSRWKRIWQNERPKLDEWKRGLAEAGGKRTPGILRDLETLYRYTPNLEEFTVYLLISNTRGCGGGANVGKNKITLECSGMDYTKRGDVVRVLGTFWHEFAHICSRKFVKEAVLPFMERADLDFIEVYKESHPERIGFPDRVFITEGLIQPVFAQGCLGKKYFNLDPERQFNQLFVAKTISHYPTLGQWGILCAHKLSGEAARYLEEGKPLNEDFLNKIVETIREFLEIIQ